MQISWRKTFHFFHVCGRQETALEIRKEERKEEPCKEENLEARKESVRKQNLVRKRRLGISGVEEPIIKITDLIRNFNTTNKDEMQSRNSNVVRAELQ